MGCTTTVAVVTAATGGGLLSPLRKCAMRGASAQNGINHNRMSDTPTRRRNGDRPADSVSLVADVRGVCLIPDSVRWAWAHAVSRPGTTVCHGHRTNCG
jgi:hypothetical protein